MAKILNGIEQAQRLFSRHMDLRGWSKSDQKKADAAGYRSDVTLARRTADLGRASGKIFEREGITKIKDITPNMAHSEVKLLKEAGYSSSTIAGYAKSLSDAHQLLHGSPIEFGSLVPSRSSDVPVSGRAYSGSQVAEIIGNQPPIYGLMTEVSADAGLRVSELNTIRPAEKFHFQISEHRLEQLVDYRFAGKEGVDYIVTGKGGLDRIVRVSEDMSEKLEAFRLDEPREIESLRGEDHRTFEQHYDLPNAEEWARNFSETSKDLFNFSHGPHGLRHTYAQERMKELQSQGYSWDQSRLATSCYVPRYISHFVSTFFRLTRAIYPTLNQVTCSPESAWDSAVMAAYFDSSRESCLRRCVH